MKRTILLVLLLGLLISGCSDKNITGLNTPTQATTTQTGSAEPIAVDFAKTDADMFTQRDEEASYN